MKRGVWTRAMALGLAAALGLGLAACGEGGENHGGHGMEEVNGGGTGTSAGGKTGQAGKENVYSFQELNLTKTNENINNMVYRDGRLYLLVYSGGGSGEESVGQSVFGCYQSNADGSDSSFTELALPEREQTYNWIDVTLLSAGGQIYAVESSGYEDSSDPDNYIYEDRYYLDCWNPDGSLQYSTQLSAGGDGEWAYCSRLIDGGEEGVYALMSGNRNEAVLYSPQGVEVSRKVMDSGIFERASLVYAGENGKLMVIYYDEEYTKRFLASYDLETAEEGEAFELPFSQNYSISAGDGEELLLTDSLGLYTWRVGDAEPRMLMNIVNSDLAANEINSVQRIDEQHFVALYSDIANWEQRCAYFTYRDPADIPDREELVLGGTYLGSSVKAEVIRFNKNSDQYRITIKDYSVYNTSEDWMAGQTRLNSDIVSGQMPDIMLLGDMSNFGNYVSKGALADIGSLLEADPELKELEYLQNVRDAFSVNGRLYAAVSCFSVRTMAAKKSLVGEPETWTMADAEAVVATMPQGATIFGDMERDSFISYMMSYAGQDFIDVETGKCNFNSQSFMDMLEYARTLPKDRSMEYDEGFDYAYYENQYRENRTLLYDLFIGNLKDCKYQIKGSIGEEVSFVGFPTAASNGSVLGAGNFSFTISAKSQNVEGAWQFVRQFLTPEYQNNEDMYYMPVLKSAFLDKAQKATERPYWTDENGNREYYDDTCTVNGEEIILEPFTQEEVDQICQFIYTVNRAAYNNEEIRNIITEDAEAFFTGQKSAQEVADIIQSRAQIYVNENR